MSSLDRFTRIGIGDIGAAEQAADSQQAAQASLTAAFEKKQQEASELKDNILDNVETELFRKPVEDLTHKGFQKIGDVSRKVLRQGSELARAKIAGQPADTRVPSWSTKYNNPAFDPEANATAATEEATPTVARTPRSVEQLAPELEDLPPSLPVPPSATESAGLPRDARLAARDARLAYAQNELERTRVNSRNLQRVSDGLKNTEVGGGGGNPTSSGGGSGEGGSGIGDDTQGSLGPKTEAAQQDASDAAKAANQTLTGAEKDAAEQVAKTAGTEVAEGAVDAAAASSGGLDIFADLAAVGLAIGTAIAGHHQHEAEPPKLPSLSASTQFGI
jgi:hypothetical protein